MDDERTLALPGLDGSAPKGPAVDLLADLDDAQRAVVLHHAGPARVAAGAGAGKTRALVHRAAHLCAARGVAPERVLLVTFTRKAAGEMAARAARLLGHPRLRVQTFHALARSVLAAELPGFRDLDLDGGERYRVWLKRACGHAHLRWDGVDIEALAGAVGLAKAHRLGPDDEGLAPLLARAGRRLGPEDRVRAAYRIAEELRRDARALTFDDWLVEVATLLERDEDARRRWAGRFDFVIQDEAQDQSPVQVAIATALARDHRCYMVVGDANQAIYRWRGADPASLVRFADAWPDAAEYELATNYRSCPEIVAAANRVVDAMDPAERLELRMRAVRTDAAEVTVRAAESQEDEAGEVADALRRLHAEGLPWRDAAVLYRTNAGSRAVEEALLRARVPYHLVNGVSFYERKEVRDLLAYLRCAADRGDGGDARRSLVAPSRKLGRAFLEALEGHPAERGVPVDAADWRGVAVDAAAGTLRGFQLVGVHRWADVVDAAAACLRAGASAGEALERIAQATDFRAWLLGDEGRDSVEHDRYANVVELCRVARQFATAAGFLEHVAAHVRATKEAAAADRDPERVTLMTVHASKGLEHRAVFVVSCNDRLFPHVLAEDAGEERRIFYVALTRAMDRLHVSYVRRAVSGGRVVRLEPSPFLYEAGLLAREPAAAVPAPAAAPRPGPDNVIDLLAERDRRARAAAALGEED